MRMASQNQNSKNRRAEMRIALMIGLLSVIVMLTMWMTKENINNDSLLLELSSEFNNLLESLTGDKILSLFLSQLSLTFITISVMSVLSEKTVTLYWVNLVEENLIAPRFRCFYAYVIYSFTTIAINMFAILFSNKLLFVVFFIINIVVLFLLTYSMLTVYFRQDSKERKAIKNFKKDEENQNTEERSKKMKKLKEYTLKAYSNNDIDTLNKNLEFYSMYCKVEDVMYFMKNIDSNNIELLGDVLLRGYVNQIKYVISKSEYVCIDKEEIKNINLDSMKIVKEALDNYNIINMLPHKLLDDIMSKENRNEYHQFYKEFLISVRSIMILHFNFVSEKEIIGDNIKTYKEFRSIIRDGIRLLKNEGIVDEKYSTEIYAYEKQHLGCLNDDILNSFFDSPTERYYAYHEGLRRLPIRAILKILKSSIDDGNHYFVTVFIATFQQFPIFKYLSRLDRNYSNNSVYKEIHDLCHEINEKAHHVNENNEAFLNPDWIELFREIFGK